MPKYTKLDIGYLGYDNTSATGNNTENFEVMLQGVYRQMRQRNRNRNRTPNRNRNHTNRTPNWNGMNDKNTPLPNQLHTKTKTKTKIVGRSIRTGDVTDNSNDNDNDNDNGKGKGNNIQILKLTPEERSRLENTILFCFGSLFKFDANLVGGEKFTSTAQMRATPPPAVLEFGRDVLPPLMLDADILPDTPIVYGRNTSSIWGEIHPYLEIPINLHYAWRLLNYDEVFAVTMRYGLKRSVTEIGHSLGYKGTGTRPVNNILNRALLKLAPALLDLDLPIPVTVEGLEGV